MDGTSPLLTKTQREVLLDIAEREDVDTADATERSHRSRLKNRVKDIIGDFAFLMRYLPRDDRRALFDDLHAYNEFREREREAIAELPSEGERRMRAVPDTDEQEEEGREVRTGIVATLAFLYAGVDDRLEFEALLEDAIRSAARQDGRLPLDVNVEITETRKEDQPSREALIEEIQSRDLDADRLEAILSADPTVLFEAAAGEEDEDDEE